MVWVERVSRCSIDTSGKLERLPFIEEKVSGGNVYDVTNCWSAARGHNSSHIVPPSLVPQKPRSGIGAMYSRSKAQLPILDYTKWFCV